MPELRLTLLVVGLLFLVGLAWWELRRPHQVRGSDLPRPGPEPDWDLPPPTTLSRTRSPELELPRMSAHDPEQQLPVIEVGADEFAALEATAQSPQAPTLRNVTVALDAPGDAFEEESIEAFDPGQATEPVARLLDPAPVAGAPIGPVTGDMEGLLDELGAEQGRDPPISDIHIDESPQDHAPEPDVVIRAAPVPEFAPEAVSPAELPAPEPPSEVIVDWPEPDASVVLAVRVVSIGEKFPGRAVRMALAAEGFVLGKFSIMHKPGPDGRALLSIASLNKPGTFDASTIDMQRYGGLNLFTILPGPLPGPAAVDELLACAQVLSQRLRAALQDDKGQPLTPSRTAAMRDQAAAAPT